MDHHPAGMRLLETADWTLIQLKSQLLEIASWTLVQLRSASRPGRIPAVEGSALPSLPALERGVSMEISLLQTASSKDRDLRSDPLELTFLPGPRQFINCQNWSHRSGLVKTKLDSQSGCKCQAMSIRDPCYRR